MATTYPGDDGAPSAYVLAPCPGDGFWPVVTRWRALVLVGTEFRPPEWALQRAKPVPLSSRNERSLLEAVRTDDGRAVLERAAEPGEHRVAASVIAALRLAEEHPDRALRYLAWLAESPDDPASLRFLRRYFPGLHVLVRLDADLGVAAPLGRDTLGLLAAELLVTSGEVAKAEELLAGLTPSAPVAYARCALRLARGDAAGVHALAEGRPIVDDVTVALRVMNARAREAEGDATAALVEVNELVEGREVGAEVARLVTALRSRLLRAAGRDLEADMIDEDFGHAAPPASEPETTHLPEADVPVGPLYGRSVTDALDDAWARVRRQRPSGQSEPYAPGIADARCEEAIALVRAGHLEGAETLLLAEMDRVDALVDAGEPVVDDFFVVLAGVFHEQDLMPEEVATLERLRDAHRRAGSEPDAEVTERLVEIRSELDRLR